MKSSHPQGEIGRLEGKDNGCEKCWNFRSLAQDSNNKIFFMKWNIKKMKNSSHVSSLLLNTSSEKVGQRIFYLSCFWQPSESDWAVSSMCFPILPYFPRKNISIFYLMCNLAPSTISQNSRCKVSLQESSPYQCLDNVLPTICVRDARKIRRKKEMRRRWRPSNRDGLYIYIIFTFLMI